MASPGTIWVGQSPSTVTTWYAIAFGAPTTFVAVANSGDVMVSNDQGFSWTDGSASEANTWNGIAYGGGSFVAVSSDGTNRVMTSPDGFTWTPVSVTVHPWYAVTYGGGLFVAVASDGAVMTSPTGAVWTLRTAASASNWLAVAFGGGVYVATSDTDDVMTSPDGVTWTSHLGSEAASWYGLAYGNGTFTAVSDNPGGPRVMTSPTGTTWTSQTAIVDDAWDALTFGDGLFVAVAYSGTNLVMTSPDGITWTARSAAAFLQWFGVAYGDGAFVAIANDGLSQVMLSIETTPPPPPVGAVLVGDTRMPSRRNGKIGPIAYGGALWAFGIQGQTNTPISTTWLTVEKSVDLGATWEYVDFRGFRVSDRESALWGMAPGQDNRTFGLVQDPNNLGTIVIFYRAFTGSDPYRITSFDMDTGLWGSAGASGAVPDTVDPTSLQFFDYQAHMAVGISSTSGRIYVLSVGGYDQATSPTSTPKLLAARCYYAVMTGGPAGTWESGAVMIRVPNQTTDPATGLSVPASYYPLAIVGGAGGRVHGFLAMVKDAATGLEPAGVCHFLLDDGAGNTALSVTQITASGEIWPITEELTGTVGFDVAAFPSTSGTGLVFAYGVENGGNIDRKILYCLDDSSPSWVSQAVDTVALLSTYPHTWGVGVDSGSDLVFRYGLGESFFVPNSMAERSWDGLTQTLGAEVVLDVEDLDVWFIEPTVMHTASVGSVFGTTYQMQFPVEAVLPLYSMGFLGVSAPPPTPATPPITPPPYGARIVVKCPNYYDYCMAGERGVGRFLRGLAVSRPMPGRNAERISVQSPYTVLPMDGVEYRKQGSILLPVVEGVDTLVLRWRVPTGYDGVIWGVMFLFTGTGYLEGSGDLIYRVNVSRRWVKDLGNVNNSLGSLNQTFPLTEHERIQSQQTISVYVYLGAGALGRLDPAGRVIVAVDGWLYGMCKQQVRF